jgi:hypothetical protein
VRVLLSLAFLSASLSGQWLKQPTAGIPRTPDGKPNLTAPAPRGADGKPDFSGVWRINSAGQSGDVTQDLKPEEIQPSARDLFKQRSEDLGKDAPWMFCLPGGPVDLLGAQMQKILQTPSLITVLYEDLGYRQIFMDGRPLPEDPSPAWRGYSVGHWDGDTLVIEASGYTDRSWLDGGGHPHSEALHTTERLHRKDFGHMDVQVTFNDPAYYSRPWTITMDADYLADTDLIEYVCAENEKDRTHLVGKASDEQKLEVKVAREILSQYAGTYITEVSSDPTDKAMALNVAVEDDHLVLDLDGKGKAPLIALSETNFYFAAGGVSIDFERDPQGRVNRFIFHVVEGDFKANRKP